ncbi:hypothetical protein C1H46_006250 [Malus baccata]|uniref:Uncharacterized protein n=1 Tax=Malus baccata TaxID=106549 RepID=A0A540NAR9_MALBA|nr:hypothetical protein C1H46_006250 [Malus baccata]
MVNPHHPHPNPTQTQTHCNNNTTTFNLRSPNVAIDSEEYQAFLKTKLDLTYATAALSRPWKKKKKLKTILATHFLSYMRDPLLNELDVSSFSLFSNPSCTARVEDGVTTTTFGGGGGHHVLNLGHHNHQSGGVVVDGDPIKRLCNIFSQMLQISPSAKVAMLPCDSSVIGGTMSSSPRRIKTSPDSATMVASNMIINRNSSSAAKGCLLGNTRMQISSPRNPGIKRMVVAM